MGAWCGGDLLQADETQVILVTDSGKRVRIDATMVRSWREVPEERAVIPSPDESGKASAIAIAGGAGVAASLGCGLGMVGCLTIGQSLTSELGVIALVAMPAAAGAAGAIAGAVASSEGELQPMIVVVGAAAAGGALVGGAVGALSAATTANPTVIGIGGIVGAGAGAAIAAHVSSLWTGVARDE
jgi:hypothetical protein